MSDDLSPLFGNQRETSIPLFSQSIDKLSFRPPSERTIVQPTNTLMIPLLLDPNNSTLCHLLTVNC